MKKINDADMLAAIVRASNHYAMRPALVLDNQTYTYQELFGLAWSICETLRNLKEDIIGITAENRMETYASILAVLLSGKTYVMLHPDYPAERNCRIARQSGIGLLLYSLRDKEGFDMIWRYFAWTNQTLSVFTLWAITVYLVRGKKGYYYYVTYLPAVFMTAVCTTYICIAPEGFGMRPGLAFSIAIFSASIAVIWFNVWYFKTTKKLR